MAEPDTQPFEDDPVPTEPAGLVPNEDAPVRKPREPLRLGLAAAAVAAVAAVLGAVLWGSYQSQRHAAELAQLGVQAERGRADDATRQRTEARLRGEGQGALAMQEAGMFAPAVVALARIAQAMPSLDGGVYAQAARFLAPRLLSFDEATRSIAPGEAVRWQGSNLVRGLDGKLREVPGGPIAAHLFAPAGTELLVVGTDRQARLYQWPALTTTGPHPVGAVCIDSLDVLPDGRFAIDTATTGTTSASSAARIVLSRDGVPSPPVPRETSAVSRCAPGTGKPGAEATSRAPPQRRLQFPQLRDEAAFWRVGTRPEPAKEQPAVLPLDMRDRPPYGELDVSALPAGEREGIQRSLSDEALTTGLVRAGNRSTALALYLVANQSTALRICDFDTASRKVAACGAVPMAASVTPVYAPDYRRVLLAANDAQEEAFRLVDLTRLGQRCKVAQPPGERVDTAAFNSAGDRLAVVTLRHELWSYELTPACEARLVLRQALPALREGTRTTIAWLDGHTVVWVAGQGEVFAFDARDGLMRWARHALWPLAGRGVQVRASGDGRLVAIFDQRHLQLAAGANGLPLAGLLDTRTLRSAEQKTNGEICDAELATSGALHLRVQAGSCTAGAVPASARSDWRRLPPDDPQLGFGGKPGLAQRTAISERDGRTALTLEQLVQ